MTLTQQHLSSDNPGDRFIVKTPVIANEMIANNLYRITFDAHEIANAARAGQFVNILITDNWDPLLRRPMSIAGVNGTQFDLMYKVVGDGTKAMSRWQAGEAVDIMGPLGNGWSIMPETYPVIIGGGAGIAPIQYLHDSLAVAGRAHHLIMGARNSTEHYFNHVPTDGVSLSTNDGSLGVTGTVLDALRELRNRPEMAEETISLYGCGPPRMMEGLKAYASGENLDCQLALEEMMACGIGLCQGCTVSMNVESRTKHSYRERYQLVCLDGPVFNTLDLA